MHELALHSSFVLLANIEYSAYGDAALDSMCMEASSEGFARIIVPGA